MPMEAFLNKKIELGCSRPNARFCEVVVSLWV